ncbi:Verlamelin biosynthesis protein B [Paramyrothecium foliicola]|nr:Verlamelin biosynthesis protein B [Paramyrothecium foliicola]
MRETVYMREMLEIRHVPEGFGSGSFQHLLEAHGFNMTQNEHAARSLGHFLQVPWCAAILRQPRIETFLPLSLTPTKTPSGDVPTKNLLFTETLNNQNAIPAFIGFYKIPPLNQGEENQPAHVDVSSQPTSTRFQINSVSLMFDLQPGVNGFTGLAHGGLIATLADEAMGNLLILNSELQNRAKARGSLPKHILDLAAVGSFFTAEMNVKFQKPLVTPQIVVVTVDLRKIEGRKLFLGVTVLGENNVKFVACEGLWISPGTRKL